MNNNYKSYRSVITLLILLIGYANNYAQSDTDFAGDTLLWDKIDITSPEVKENKKRLPWYIPAAGVAALATGSYFVLTHDRSGSVVEDPAPIANNLDITIECGDGGEVTPMENDEGDDIRLVNFTAPSGLVTQQDNILVISTDAINSFTIFYTIENEFGRQATAMVSVTVNQAQTSAQDIQMDANRGEPVSLNIFDAFDCERCNLVFVEQSEYISNLTFNADGDVSFMVNNQAPEEININYTIRDKCQNNSNARILVILPEETCNIIGELVVENSTCGLNNGSVTFETQNDNYEYVFDNSIAGSTISNLGAGQYELQIRDTTKVDCEEVFEFEVLNNPASYLEVLNIKPFNCYEKGDVEFQWNEDNTDPSILFNVELTDGLTTHSVEVNPNGTFALSDIFPDVTLEGQISLEVTPFGADTECKQDIDISIEEEPVDIQANDNTYMAQAGSMLTANVLDNDNGVGLSVTSFTPIPMVPVFSVEDNGLMTFLSEPFVQDNYIATYMITDTCGQTAEANIIIQTIIDIDCSISVDLGFSPADCGDSNGFAQLTLAFNGLDNPQWSLPDEWMQEGENVFINDNIPAGTYNVMINEAITGCDTIFTFEIQEREPEYILNLRTEAADCRPNGDIILTISDFFDEYDLSLSDSNGDTLGTWVVTFGSNKLSDLTEIASGQYTVSLIPSDLPERCTEAREVEVEEEQPELSASDVTATIQQGTFWTGNALDNDNGEELSVLSFTPPAEGSFTLSEDGNGQFTPPPGFTGSVSIEYVITDVCEQTDTAFILIEVIEVVDCIFDVNISVTDATCSLANGMVSVTVEDGHCEDGNLCFEWEDGSTGSTNELPAGTYQISVTSAILGCTEVFPFTIGAITPTLIENFEVSNESCVNAGGEAIIHLTDNSQLYDMARLLINRDGQLLLDTLVDWSTVNTSDFIDLDTGSFNIIISPDIEGSGCDTTIAFDIIQEIFDFEIFDIKDTILFNTTWNGNVLENATGTGLEVINFNGPLVGQASVASNGDASFTPPMDFVGSISFNYIVEDTCSVVDTAKVTITVLPPECEFIDMIDTSPASCNDGGDALIQFTLPENNVLFIQLTTPTGDIISFDQTSPMLELSSVMIVQSGHYTLTASDPDLGGLCSDQQTFTISDHIPPSIQVLNAVPPDSPGNNNGFITLLLNGSIAPFVVFVNDIPYGPFFAGSALIPQLSEGFYTIYALDGASCPSDTLTIALFTNGLGDSPAGIQFFTIDQSAQTELINTSIQASLRELSTVQNVNSSHINPVPSMSTTAGFIQPLSGRLNGGVSVAYHSFLIPNQQFQNTNGYFQLPVISAGLHMIPSVQIGTVTLNLNMGYYFGAALNNQSTNQLNGATLDNDFLNFLQFNPTILSPITNQLSIQTGFDLQLLMNRRQQFRAIPMTGILYNFD